MLLMSRETLLGFFFPCDYSRETEVKPPLSGHSCSAGSKNYPTPAVLMGCEQAVRAGSHPSTKAMDQQAAPTGEKGEILHHFPSRFPRASEKCY